MKRGVRCRYAGVDRALQKHFLDLVPRDAVVERGAHVQLEFVAAIERNHQADRQQAACMPRQAGSRPNLAPCITRDQVLELAVECVSPCLRTIHMRVAEHGAPHFHAF